MYIAADADADEERLEVCLLAHGCGDLEEELTAIPFAGHHRVAFNDTIFERGEVALSIRTGVGHHLCVLGCGIGLCHVVDAGVIIINRDIAG